MLTAFGKATGFNTQPPEGGCIGFKIGHALCDVSTHSHPKVAALEPIIAERVNDVSTHSHPKVAAHHR